MMKGSESHGSGGQWLLHSASSEEGAPVQPHFAPRLDPEPRRQNSSCFWSGVLPLAMEDEELESRCSPKRKKKRDYQC